MRRLTVFSPGDVISAGAVTEPTRALSTSPRPRVSPRARLGRALEAKGQVVDAFTRRYVRLLKQTRGNVSEAARVSGLERVSLQKILKRLGIAADAFR